MGRNTSEKTQSHNKTFCLLTSSYLLQFDTKKRMDFFSLRHSVFGWSSPLDVQGHSVDDCTLGFGLGQL